MSTKESALKLLNIKGNRHVYVVNVSDDILEPDLREITVGWDEFAEVLQKLLDSKYNELKQSNKLNGGEDEL